jgi:hypothetical protein
MMFAEPSFVMLNPAWIAGHACKAQFNHHHVSQLWVIVANQLDQEKHSLA